MGFVDDVDLAHSLGGGEVHLLTDIAYLVDAPVAGGVQFDDVHELAAVDRHAVGAGVAGVAVLGVEAVHPFGYDPGRGGLAAASGTAEQIGVGDAPLLDGLAQCAGDVVLPHQLAEAGRPPLAVEDLGGGGRLVYGLAGHDWRVSIMFLAVCSVPDGFILGFTLKC